MSYELITLTAGHNEKVVGASGNGYKEHQQARLLVAQLVKDFKAVGQKVAICTDNVGTTKTSVWMNAVRKCNSHPAKGRLDISIHLNATPGGTGVEVLYYSENELAARVSKAIANTTGLRDRGAKQRKDIGFLNSTDAPAILIEACFIDNKNDMVIWKEKMKDISKSIVKAVTGKTVEKETVKATTSTKKYHTVGKGDTVSKLAKEYGSTQKQIKEWNKLNDAYLIKIGQKLRVK